MDKKPPPELIFVIIHGTASRGARWTLPTSKIRRRLERHFNRRGRTFSFEWSGTNSNLARLTAGKDLARRILELYEEHRAPIYLIAHSHGGNIALYAMRDASVEEKVAGVICIGTLFVKCGQRPFVPTIEKCLKLLPRLAGATVLGAIALMQFTGTGVGKVFNVATWVRWAAFLLMPFIAILHDRWAPWYKHACDLWLEKLRADVRSRSDSAIAALSLPRLPNLKLLCLYSPHDEASKCLRGGIFIAETPFLAWRFLNKLADVVLGGESGLAKLLSLAFYTGGAAAFASMFDWDHRIPSLHWLILLMIPRLAGVILIIMAFPVILFGHVFFAAIAKVRITTGLRWKSILDDWITEMTVHPAPEGPKDIIVKEMNVVAGSLNFRARNLRTFMAVTAHTRMYNNQKVLTEIMRWIYKQEERRAKSAPGTPIS